LLFPGANGGWLRPSSFWGIFDVARKAAGWEGDFHDLRHTGISAYSKLPGVTVKELLRWSGHSTLGVSLRYPHVDEEDARDLVQGMQIGDERVGSDASAAREMSPVLGAPVPPQGESLYLARDSVSPRSGHGPTVPYRRPRPVTQSTETGALTSEGAEAR